MGQQNQTKSTLESPVQNLLLLQRSGAVDGKASNSDTWRLANSMFREVENLKKLSGTLRYYSRSKH